MGSLFKIEADQDSGENVKMIQKEGKFKVELVMPKNHKIKYLPRLRRRCHTGTFQPLFLCLEPHGIEVGNYSTLTIFTGTVSEWDSEIKVEGWSSYKEIYKIIFTQKNGTKITLDHTNKSGMLPIDIKNPVVKIEIQTQAKKSRGRQK